MLFISTYFNVFVLVKNISTQNYYIPYIVSKGVIVMLGNQSLSPSREPINLGLSIFAPISSAKGSATIFIFQPLLTGSVFASALIMIISEFLLFILDRVLRIHRLPVLNVQSGQIIQMPLPELQEFLKWMTKGANYTTSPTMPADGINQSPTMPNDGQALADRGFITPETLEAPVILSITITSNFADLPNSPTVSLIVPIFRFPNLRGGLPLLILGLLTTIFLRAVITPDLTGATPLFHDTSEKNLNNLILTPNDLLELLSRFGKQFSTK